MKQEEPLPLPSGAACPRPPATRVVFPTRAPSQAPQSLSVDSSPRLARSASPYGPSAPLNSADAAPAAPPSVFDDMMVNYGSVFAPTAPAPACDPAPALFPLGTPSSSTLAAYPSYAGDLAYYAPPAAPPGPEYAPYAPPDPVQAVPTTVQQVQKQEQQQQEQQQQQREQQQQQQQQEVTAIKTPRQRGGESAPAAATTTGPRPRKRRARAADDDGNEATPEDAGSGRGSPLDAKERKAGETKRARSRGAAKRPPRVTGPRGSASSSALVSPSTFAGSPQVPASNAPMFGGGYPDMVTKQAKLYEVLDQAIGDHVDLTQASAMVPSILQLYIFLKFVNEHPFFLTLLPSSLFSLCCSCFRRFFSYLGFPVLVF